MRTKPDWKTAGIAVNGRFRPGVATPGTLADMGMLDPQAANKAVIHYQNTDFACFTAGGVTVKVLPAHLSAESSRRPYRRVRDVVYRLVEGLPDVRVCCLQFHRTIHFPAGSSDWNRMAETLVAEFGGFALGGGRIGAMELDRWKPGGGALAITAGPSERLLNSGGTGIRIDVRDSYHGGDPGESTERLLRILATEFADSVSHADLIVDRLMLLCESPRRRSMAA